MGFNLKKYTVFLLKTEYLYTFPAGLIINQSALLRRGAGG
jgi:hypothetical protein